MTPDELMLFMFDCALASDCSVCWHSLDDEPIDLLKVAAYYDDDVATARGDKPAEAATTPSTAARAAKGANAKGGKKPNVSLGALMRAGAGVDLLGEPIAGGQTDEAGFAGKEVKDEPADAGVERDPNTSDMLQEGALA